MKRRLTSTASKIMIAIVVLAIVGGGVYYAFFRPSTDKTVTAQFASAVGLYKGTPVRILGVDAGEVTEVKPQAQYVAVTMTYSSKFRIRAKDAAAVEVANSLVSDRYVNLSTLIAKDDSSAALPDHATIPVDRTGGPAELDDIYAQLDKLAVALGPNGANQGGQSGGALSALLKVSAANLQGNGKALGQSIKSLAAATQTLADHKGDLFGTVKNLQKFTATLKASDGQVRKFNQLLAQVTGDLASERSDLGAALHDLGIALDQVAKFVKDNAAGLHTTLGGLADITGVLVKQKASLAESLAVAPYALANIVHAYQPDTGTLGTRSNIVSLGDTDSLTQQVTTIICSIAGVGNGLPVLGGALGSICKTAGGTSTSSGSSGAVTKLQNGGLPIGPMVGGGS